MASFGSMAATTETTTVIEKVEMDAVSVSITVTSDGNPVSGALVKIVNEKTVVAAGTTNENGVAAIKLPTYSGEGVTIEVYHRLYKTSKKQAVVLSDGGNVPFSLRSKSTAISEVEAEAKEKEDKLNEKIQGKEESKAEYEKRMAEAKERQEKLQQETNDVKSQTE